MGEFELIAKLSRLLDKPPAGWVGIGDDCAIQFSTNPTGGFSAYTIDTLVSGVHFDMHFSSAEEIGAKAVAVNISDLAAVGASPQVLLISLQIPTTLSEAFLQELYRGMNAAASQFGCAVVGGDTVSADQFALSICAIGQGEKRPLLRSEAQVGDDIWVSGVIGEAWCGLQLLKSQLHSDLLKDPERCLRRHRAPVAQVILGKKLAAEPKVHAAIDVSDGLFADMRHIAIASAVTCEIFLDHLPTCFREPVAESLLLSALTGGDDYELLWTAAPGCRKNLECLGATSRIGTVNERRESPLVVKRAMQGATLDLDKLPLGYTHR